MHAHKISCAPMCAALSSWIYFEGCSSRSWPEYFSYRRRGSVVTEHTGSVTLPPCLWEALWWIAWAKM